MTVCLNHDSPLAKSIADFCVADFQPPTPAVRAAFPTSTTWQRLAGTGTDLWLDTGDIDAANKLWTQEFAALTTNNTLLNKEVQKGIYDDLVPRAAALLKQSDPGIPDELLVQEIAFILNAVHGLGLVQTFDADVSVELHTNLAWDTAASYQYGKRFAAINPDRFIIKVPLTAEGVFAARKLRADGIRVNFTLGFSARENYLIAVAAQPNWVNVFMGRCNAFVADNGLGDGNNVGEKATLASQRMLRRACEQHGLEVRQIGASMRGGQQAFDLMGLDVYTMPTGVAEEYLKLDPPAAEVRDRTAADPEVSLADGADPASCGIDCFWNISDALDAAMAALSRENLDQMTGAELCGFLRDHQLGDLFPELSPEELARVAAESKIPRHDSWAARVAAGTAGWDSMLTAAALQSFAADQRQLDDRIRQHL